MDNKNYELIKWAKGNEHLFSDNISDSISDIICCASTNNESVISYDFLELMTDNNIRLNDNAGKFLIERIGTFGSTEHLDWLITNNYKHLFEYEVVNKSIINSLISQNISVLEWYKNNGCKFDEFCQFVIECVRYGKLVSLEWLYDNYNELFLNVMKSSEKKTQLLKFNINCTTVIDHVFCLCSTNDHVDIINWLLLKNFLIDKKIINTMFINAFANGSKNVLNMMNKKIITINFSKMTFDKIPFFENNFCGTLDWLKENGVEFTDHKIVQILSSTYVNKPYGNEKHESKILEWLQANVINTENVLNIVNGLDPKHYCNTEILEWIKYLYPEHTKLIDKLLKKDGIETTETKRGLFF